MIKKSIKKDKAVLSLKPRQTNNSSALKLWRDKKIIAVVGPTGSGKTAWAKKLAQKFNAKVISVDSRQIYRGMDIGTAKDKTFAQDLIDIIEPHESYSVARYQQAASDLINQYFKMNNLPILVGGTGLYLESILYGYIIPELKNDSLELRRVLEKLSDKELFKKLIELDRKAAEKIDPQNRRRVIRALEVTMLSKIPFSRQQKKRKPRFESLILGIKTDRETLYAKIDARIEQMIKDGLVEEVRDLVKKYGGYKEAFNAVGYKEIIDYFNGKYTLKEAIEKIKTNTHALVRRQETWYRHDKNIKWVSSIDEAEKEIDKFLKKS